MFLGSLKNITIYNNISRYSRLLFNEENIKILNLIRNRWIPRLTNS